MGNQALLCNLEYSMATWGQKQTGKDRVEQLGLTLILLIPGPLEYRRPKHIPSNLIPGASDSHILWNFPFVFPKS